MSAESRKAGLNVTLMVSGSIACYKACELTSMLVKDGHAVQVVATRAALRFVGRASFEGLCDRPVYSSLWTPRDSKVHITLRRWTDLYIFYPATANRVNRLASGLAEDIVGAAFLANSFEKPFWIAPAANEGMLRHPATQAAVRKLQDWGCEILLGERGRLACGDNGEGRLAEPEAVAGLVRAFHRSKMRAARARARRVLITGGGMTEPIDSVRFIANRSSGRTAAAISAAFLDRGWEVRLLCHDTATDERCEGADIRRYGTYGELAALLGASLSEQPWDAVVHSAAVSDYRLAGGRYDGKIESDGPLDLRLEKNPKLLDSIKPQARAAGYPEPFLVAFK